MWVKHKIECISFDVIEKHFKNFKIFKFCAMNASFQQLVHVSSTYFTKGTQSLNPV